MSSMLPMTDYRHSRQYAPFSTLDALNYCLNIFDNGDTLSIVVDAGAHGSHVAGMLLFLFSFLISPFFHVNNVRRIESVPGVHHL